MAKKQEINTKLEPAEEYFRQLTLTFNWNKATKLRQFKLLLSSILTEKNLHSNLDTILF